MKSITLYAAFERYAKEVSVFKKGHEQEKSKIKHWKQSELAAKPLVFITSGDIAAHRDLRVQQKIGANTIRIELAVLSHLFEIARKEWGFGHIHNPVKLVRRIRLPKGRDRRINDEEEAFKLFQSCKEFGGQQLYNIVRFAIETAMRRSEIISLTWEDINCNGLIKEDTSLGL